jgi:mRNA-degrading endonuclease toxin of MazEF toxin-antitoxin module
VHWAELDKRRPALIVSPDYRNAGASDLILVPISSVARRMNWHVFLRGGEGGLAQDSAVKCEGVLTLPKRLVEPEELGVLSPARMLEVEAALKSALGIQD